MTPTCKVTLQDSHISHECLYSCMLNECLSLTVRPIRHLSQAAAW